MSLPCQHSQDSQGKGGGSSILWHPMIPTGSSIPHHILKPFQLQTPNLPECCDPGNAAGRAIPSAFPCLASQKDSWSCLERLLEPRPLWEWGSALLTLSRSSSRHSCSALRIRNSMGTATKSSSGAAKTPLERGKRNPAPPRPSQMELGPGKSDCSTEQQRGRGQPCSLWENSPSRSSPYGAGIQPELLGGGAGAGPGLESKSLGRKRSWEPKKFLEPRNLPRGPRALGIKFPLTRKDLGSFPSQHQPRLWTQVLGKRGFSRISCRVGASIPSCA